MRKVSRYEARIRYDWLKGGFVGWVEDRRKVYGTIITKLVSAAPSGPDADRGRGICVGKLRLMVAKLEALDDDG
jgi:hypothetical protein